IAVCRRPDVLSRRAGMDLTAAHFLAVLGTESLHFPETLLNSIAVSGLSAALAVAVAAPAAYAITRLEIPGRLAFLFFVLSISMFPPVSLLSYLFRFMSALGWINTYAALVLPYTAWILPLSLWILTSYFSRIPRDLDRAAQVDGCGRLAALRKVVVPVAAPGIFSTAILAFIFAFNEFLFALMLTTDRNARTIPVGIALFEGLHGEIPWGMIMAAAALAAVPVILLALAFQRRIVAGLTRGAVKE
ncbi:MAG TPA: carbohydrate ABC transporter permease, partial [Candidatus Limnocylindrales bacterium]|nr:carbohydrate ABC transporter permease [Candidatus Limnocylindrales bacterium]